MTESTGKTHAQGISSVFDQQLRSALPWTSLVLGLVFGANGLVLIFVMTPETSAGAQLHPTVPYVLLVAGAALTTVSGLLRLGYRELGSWSLIATLWAMTFGLGLISAPGPTETLIALVLGGTILLSVTFERPQAIRVVTAIAIVHWLVVFAARHVQGLTANPDPIAVAQFAIGPPVILGLFAAFVDLSLRAVQRSVVERDDANEALKVARDRAYAANNAKSAFFASMSHELRTPLNAIIGYSEMVLEDVDHLGESMRDVKRIHVAGNHLLSLVNDVLDVSAMEAGKMELAFERQAVAPLLFEVVSTVRPLFRRRSNSFQTTFARSLPAVWVDPLRFRQVVINLLSNAAKFTTNGTVSLTAELGRDGGVTIEVADTGMGISSTRLESIFDPFERDEKVALDNPEPSTGLGLAIVRQLVHLMQGEISVQSTLGEGSRFTLWLPAMEDFPGLDSNTSVYTS